ncbi:MAG: hypothetical protein EP344_00975 [Bacteroidetes bacterium]|nr:MAG: hypothetical protein EP344_00975 [Bacteroidota bacterium]
MFRPLTSILFILSGIFQAQAAILPVGPGQPYPTLPAAVAAVQPGDTIEIHAGTYNGGLFFSNLKGTPAQWITIRAAAGETVVFQGGTNALQLSDPAYLHFKDLIFQQQTGNGFNTDDGGSYDTPAHHIVFEGCTFRDMATSGNNDLLKLSGLNDFEVRHCTFKNGAAGGSGIDMVGCHQGLIYSNYFENMGSNAIQAKGGTEHIRIEGNFFKNCGQRTLNLGGSTGLAFFRPDTAHFEAANLQVYSNIIIGSVAAVAYVGSVNVEVVNNTIYLPEKWIVRILQETVDPDRFLECGDNTFRNNIVVRDAGLSTETNIGPNTRPVSFLYSNNLWYYPGNSNWSGPSLPVQDQNGIINQNPLLDDPGAGDFHIPANSPAAGAGYPATEPLQDHYGAVFAAPRSIGAAEGMPVSNAPAHDAGGLFRMYPNPFYSRLFLETALPEMQFRVQVYDARGQRMPGNLFGHIITGHEAWPAGLYIFIIEDTGTRNVYYQKVIKAVSEQ